MNERFINLMALHMCQSWSSALQPRCGGCPQVTVTYVCPGTAGSTAGCTGTSPVCICTVSSTSWGCFHNSGMQQRWQQAAAAQGTSSPGPSVQEHATARSPPQPPPSFSSRFSSLPQSFFCLQPQPFMACKFNKYSLCFSMLAVNGSAQ